MWLACCSRRLDKIKNCGHIDEKGSIVFFILLATIRKNKALQLDFCRSGETISRHIHKVLSPILKLHLILLWKSEPITDTSDYVNWKHFKGCIGAIDGTHVKVRVQKDA
ncbi:hypothetical protein LINPERPRIM_LOCUS18663 [Linum perenne]